MSASPPSPPITSVAIVGAGAMGGLYASHFAGAGFDVVAVGRGARAQRLIDDGLIVNGQPVPLRVFDAADGGSAPPVDLAIVAVKQHQLAEALEDAAPLVGEQTLFLSVLNGLSSEDVIGRRFPKENVLLCIALGMAAMRDKNRITFHRPGRLVFGEADNRVPSLNVTRVQDALTRAGLAWDTPDDMQHEMWWKFMVNVGINQASAVIGGSYRIFQAPGDARDLMNKLMAEVIALSPHAGVDLNDDDVARWHRVLDGLPADGKTSMLQDLEAGRRTEVDIFGRHVVSLGLESGVPTPFNQAVVHIINARTQQEPAALPATEPPPATP